MYCTLANRAIVTMNSIEIQEGVQQMVFLHFLKVGGTIDSGGGGGGNESLPLRNHFITIENDNSATLYPGYGQFVWAHKGEEFAISYHEEGNPKEVAGFVQYFRRLIVSHDNLKLLTDFVHDALTYAKPKNAKKIQIYSSKSRGYWDEHSTIWCQPMESVYIPAQMKQSMIAAIDVFISAKERYERFGRSYKLCYLLTGVPGSGKTSLVKAVALKYERPLYVLNFTKGLTDESLIDLMASVKDNSIILIEDIDAYFVDRKSQDINVSFSVVINILDGTLVMGNGTIIILSANNPNYLDPALIRPGRVDHILKFVNPVKSEIQAAFNDLTETTDEAQFNIFYKAIKSSSISMSGIVDFLFRYPTTYMDHVSELLEQTNIYKDIVNDKSDKIYM